MPRGRLDKIGPRTGFYKLMNRLDDGFHVPTMINILQEDISITF